MIIHGKRHPIKPLRRLAGTWVACYLAASCQCTHLSEGKEHLDRGAYELAIASFEQVSAEEACGSLEVIEARLLAAQTHLRLENEPQARDALHQARTLVSERFVQLFKEANQVEEHVFRLSSQQEEDRRLDLLLQATDHSNAHGISGALSHYMQRDLDVLELQDDYRDLQQEARLLRIAVARIEAHLCALEGH